MNIQEYIGGTAYVVGHYHPTLGTPISEGYIVSDNPENVEKLQEDLKASSDKAVKPKPATKKKNKSGKIPVYKASNFSGTVELPDYTENPEVKIVPFSNTEAVNETTVTFENAFGTIKLKVIDVLDGGTAFGLVFKNEDAVSFIPKTGETIKLSIDSENSQSVYYPGALFKWTDGIKMVMILFKTSDELPDESND